MANGKFSNPRTPNQEDLEIESAFRHVMGEDPAPCQKSVPASPDVNVPQDDILSDQFLHDLLQDEPASQASPIQQTSGYPQPNVWDDIAGSIPDDPLPPGESGEPDAPDEESPTVSKNRKIILFSLLGVVLVAVVALGIVLSTLSGGVGDDGRILNNVVVAGVNVGGLTREQAVSAVHQATDKTYTGQDMVVILPDTTLHLTPTQTGARLDVDAAVEAAFEYGRTGSRAERDAAKAQVASGEYYIGLLPYLSLDTDYIRQQLEDYKSNFNSIYHESYCHLEGDMPELKGSEDFDINAPCQTLVLNAGTVGRHLDIDAVYTQVLDAYSLHIFEVDAADAAPETTPEPLMLEGIYAELHTDPVDAFMDPETFEVEYETYGYTFDLEKATQLLSEAEPGTDVTISMEFIAPENTYASLKAMLFRDVLGYAETAHTNNTNRNTNLKLACAAINGLVLMPGEVFDYNKTLGERTAEAGYKPAAAYSGGETVQSIGGGICQVSSTLYYAALLADMEIVTRSAHSFVSSYIPFGMDATVSWGGPDFRFSNNTDYPLRIEAEVSDGYVKVRLVGTDEKDYYVKMEYKIVSTTDYETVYEDYPTDNEKGYKDGDIVQTAYTGYTVKTYRCKYSKATDALISREDEATSRYKARNLIIARVTSEETEPSTEPPTEAPATETPTEPSTEAPTEAPTEPPAEAPTDSPATDGDE